MSFINNHEVPGCVGNVGSFVTRELIRANNDLILNLKRTKPALLDSGIVKARFENRAGQEKLLAQFLMPLLAQIRWGDDQNPSLALRPPLRNND